MIGFSIFDYYIALISALVYGICFSVFECFVRVGVFFSRAFSKGVYDAAFYNGRLSEIKLYTNLAPSFSRAALEFICAVRVLIFTLGLILLSFFVLDGEVRLFVIAVSALSFCLFSKYVSPLILRINKHIFSYLLWCFVFSLRLILFIPKRVILVILYFLGRICKYFKQNDRTCQHIAIDKRDKKC